VGGAGSVAGTGSTKRDMAGVRGINVRYLHREESTEGRLVPLRWSRAGQEMGSAVQ